MVTINLKRVNRISPYLLVETDRPLFYRFTTDFGVNYSIGFEPNDLFQHVDVYEFIIINSTNSKSPNDPKLRQTILALIREFFQEDTNVMLYICSTGDNRQSQRNRLFHSWFQTSDFKGEYLYMAAEIKDVDGMPNYAAIISLIKNPKLASITLQFTETVQLLQQKPST